MKTDSDESSHGKECEEKVQHAVKLLNERMKELEGFYQAARIIAEDTGYRMAVEIILGLFRNIMGCRLTFLLHNVAGETTLISSPPFKDEKRAADSLAGWIRRRGESNSDFLDCSLTIDEDGKPQDDYENAMIHFLDNDYQLDGVLGCAGRSTAFSPEDFHVSGVFGEIITIAANKERSRKDLKKSEERLIQAKKLEALGILAGGIAHDFNNLLGAMLGNAEICREVVPESSLAGECLDDIIGAIARAKDLVRQVLDFSQASDSRKDRMILAPLVKELAKKMREDLPDTIFFNALILKEWDAVWGNPVQLRQVFVNLWQNAVQAMAESGGTLTVAMDDRKPEAPVEPSGAWLCLSVSDTGHGMAEDIRQRIFEPYFSAWKERTASGMGLAAAYGIVDGHGGMIEVHSEEGKGSVFRVFLPVCERGEKSDMPVTGTLNGNIRVFIVDDEEPVLKVFHRLMKSLGNDFIGFRDPVEALAYFTDNPSEFDLVLTDFLMPGMNGLELVRKIRKTRPDIPAILCTGRGDEMDRCLADEAGINMFLQKPFTKKQLAEAMARVVRDRR